ncbi:type I-E CRISPR-associated protein Cas5/CasD [Desulfovibrio sp. Fe33]|uniref:type I-E CRISPR-associated protein Cas5/CasD n=1 Tax=Desulfovibrio sp. Fe33 TaxID=3020842 RepID=UPI00234D8C73|nr:type I-E CRISPR-associated protein Cas5/CasD [Desulfovibrio sp. Fe33]
MQDYLVFTLRGPLQSWGASSAVGEVRATAGHPGRSGVAGLLAAALGIRRDRTAALEALHGAVRLAARADDSGERMIDYHTVQTPPNQKKVTYYTRRDELLTKVTPQQLSTILSEREYLAGAAFTVCVWLEGDAGYGLAAMREALRHPRLTLYLGRKSCPPGFPLLPEVISARDAAAALALYDAQHGKTCAAGRGFARPTDRPVWSDEGHGIEGVEERTTRYSVRDVLSNAAKRQFALRRECHFLLPEEQEADHVHE